MKRTISILLAMILLFVGSSCQQFSEVDEQENTITWEKTDQTLYLHKDTVYYERDGQIFSLTLSTEGDPTLLMNGDFIGGFGKILLACDLSHYYVMDLNAGTPCWEKLLKREAYTYTSALQTNKKILLFGKIDHSEKGFVDSIDLKSLAVSRKETDFPLLQPKFMGNTLYYVRKEKERSEVTTEMITVRYLYQADIQNLTECRLCKINDADYYPFGDQVLIWGNRYDEPKIYDLTAKAEHIFMKFPVSQTPPVQIYKGVAIFVHPETKEQMFYDVANKKFLDHSPFGEQTPVRILENALIFNFSSPDSTRHVYCIEFEEKPYVVDLFYHDPGIIAVNEQGVVFLNDVEIITHCWNQLEDQLQIFKLS